MSGIARPEVRLGILMVQDNLSQWAQTNECAHSCDAELNNFRYMSRSRSLQWACQREGPGRPHRLHRGDPSLHAGVERVPMPHLLSLDRIQDELQTTLPVHRLVFELLLCFFSGGLHGPEDRVAAGRPALMGIEIALHTLPLELLFYFADLDLSL